MTRRRLLVAAVGAAVAVAGFVVSGGPETVVVAPGGSPQAALDAAPRGAVVRLEAGEHRGPLVIRRAVTLQGARGARVVAHDDVDAVIRVATDGVRLEHITVEGGSTGVLVREAEDVSVRAVTVTGAQLHGIEVVDASARLSSVAISHLRSPFAQGIEVRDSDGREDSVVEDSRVSGGQEGIVSHVSEVVFDGNVVADTTMRAITVTEMSDGVVTGNRVVRARGVGLYCGDMSRCEFAHNHVEQVLPGDGGRSSAGWGLVVNYHASASSHEDELDGVAGETATFASSRIVARSPLEPGAGWGAVEPVAIATFLALVLLLAALLAARRALPTLECAPATKYGRSAHTRRWPLVALLLAGVAVQSFHMSEHVLQVFRVHVDGVPSRGGLLGAIVETEWVHFAYNVAVFAAIALALRATRGQRGGAAPSGHLFMSAALIVQGYHVVEHVAKLLQHLTTGAKVNPGLVGEHVDLVFFHYALNLTVYLAFLAASLGYLRAEMAHIPGYRPFGQTRPRSSLE